MLTYLEHAYSRWTALAAAAIAVAVVFGCDGSTGPNDGDGVLGESVWSGGIERTYVLELPASYDPGQPAPLLVLLHGTGDTGAGYQARIAIDSAAHEAGLITVYPDIDFAIMPDDAPFVGTLIAHLGARLSIDPRRVYVAGFSGGAALTHSVGCHYSGSLAAVAGVGHPLMYYVSDSCELSRPLPILFIHGTEDGAVPWDGFGDVMMSLPRSARTWALLNGCTVDPKPTQVWLPDTADDSTRVWTRTWTGCAGDVEVKLYGIEGGGHTWPGGPGPFPDWGGHHSRDISANQEILEFLLQYS
jgi:polyhydroxybutyrate depolymerase